MFYLTQFFKSLFRSKITGVLFILCTGALVTASFNQERINSTLSNTDSRDVNPYFNALISKDVNLNSISRKIKSLPGVNRVKHVKTVNANAQLEELNKALNSAVLDRLKTVKYSTLTVELTKNLKVKSQNLIREYLARLVGRESLTLSKIKYPRQNQQSDSYLDTVLREIDLIIIFSLSFIWILLMIAVVKKNSSYFFLLEKFQRKKYIKEKSMAMGVGLIVAIAILVNFYFNDNISALSSLATLTMMLVTCALLLKLKHKGPVS